MRFVLRNSLFWQVLATLILPLVISMPVLAVDTGCATPSTARLADLQSRSELQQFVRCAAAHVNEVGWPQAVQDFQTDAHWQDGPIYLFALDTDGVIIFDVSGSSQPGEDRLEGRDADGKAHIARFLFAHRMFGEGYTTYRWRNPETETLDLKVTYVHPVHRSYQGREAIIAAGYHPLDAPGSCHPAYVRASLVFTLEDAERFVHCAEHHIHRVGLRALFEFRNDPRWRSGPSYLFMHDRESLIMIMHGANPALEGTYRGEREDSTGFRFVQEMAHHAEYFGEGVTYYETRHPSTGAVQPKRAYVRNIRIDGFNYILGAGVYAPARPECRTMPSANQVDTKPELELFVRCAADLIADRGIEVFDLLLHHRIWVDGATYPFVIDQACRSIVYPLAYRSDENDCMLTDANGTLLNQNIVDIANSDAGQGYTSYLWLNPASGKVEVKTTYVIGVELEGETVAVGAGLYGLEQ